MIFNSLKLHFQKICLVAFALISLFAYNNCGKGGFEIRSQNADFSSIMPAQASIPLPVLGTETNVMAVKVGCGYPNQPCVSVTICTPGTDTCQTIPNILLDTGSYGLRIFSSLVSVGLTSTAVSGGTLAQCMSYADGTSDWGPVKKADVILGKEKASGVPIQIIDANFGGRPSDCTRPDSSPSVAGFNGILGVGLFTEDCGPGCTTIANNRIYFACTGTFCVPSMATLAQQVSNPVAFLPVNNNGVVLQLADVPEGGAPDAPGYLILGIGTRPNNTPVRAQYFQADDTGRITTDFNGKSFSSFIDSGSNGTFFPGPDSLPACNATTTNAGGFFCPSTTTSFTAIQSGINGTSRVQVSFQVSNASLAFATNSPNQAFDNLAGTFASEFDWGLPFYMGRTIFTGIDGRTSTLGKGPYWAY